MSGITSGFFSESCKITVDAPTVTGTTTIDSTALNMAGFDGVIWIVRLGSPASNNNIRAQQDTVVGMGGAADLQGTLVNSASNNVHMLDLKRPGKQFVRCRITRGTTTTIDCVIAIQYGAANVAVAQAAALTFEQWNAVPEGTA